MKFLQESIVVVLTILIVFIVNQSLPDFMLPIIIALIVIGIIYILVKIARKKGDIFTGSYLEFSIVTMVVLLAILYTGGLNSMFYFFLYFILFGISFIFEPLTVFIFLAGLILLFFIQTITGDIFGNSIRLGSLVLLSPIAFFFGRELKGREKENQEGNTTLPASKEKKHK